MFDLKTLIVNLIKRLLSIKTLAYGKVLLLLCTILCLFWIFVGQDKILIFSNLLLNRPPQLPIILFWEQYFFNKPMTKLFRHFRTCEFECIYTEDRTLIDTAQAILFHVRTTNLSNLPQTRPDQLRVFFNHEGPDQTWFKDRTTPAYDYFNLTITYRSQSSIFYPYNYFHALDGKETEKERWSEKEIDDAINNKTLLAFSAVSHCQTWSKREVYLNALRQYINITSIGRCTSNQKCRVEYCLQNIAIKHYFYFAFENAVCAEYVTEKFFRLYELVVPVILTRAIMPRSIPNDSYISASDFETPEKLSKYLTEVASNKTEYKKFFEWTRRYRKIKYEFWRPDRKCRLCEILHKQKGTYFSADIRPFMDKSVCSRDFASSLDKGNWQWIRKEEARLADIMKNESVDRSV